ncbi:MAG: lysophospholipid acyltransferase family protein [Wenzhouxiangella sp.]
MKIALAEFLIRCLALVPLAWLQQCARPLGALASRLAGRKNRIIDQHLALACPDWPAHQRQQLRRQHWQQMACLAMETGAVWHWPAQKLLDHVPSVTGWQHVEQAQAQGRGFLMVGAHMGNWEILSLYASLRQPMAYLYKAPRDPAVDQRITASRQRFGGELIASGSPAMRELLRRLRQGQGVGLLADQQPKQGEGRFVPLFGVPALTMTLVYRLAQRTGCAVLLTSSHRLPSGQGWAVEVDPASDAFREQDEATALASYHGWLEEKIRAHPAQYLWSYKRFSVRPTGEPPFYAGSGRR